MGKFKEIGEPSLALAEECAEVIQVISKKHRFNGDWLEVPEGQTKTRLAMLQEEMEDLIFHWNRFKVSMNIQTPKRK